MRISGFSFPLPLGDAYRGRCTAADGAGRETGELYCNLGYARGKCDCFPGASAPDAVRFAIGADESVMFAIERDHHPYRAGVFEIGQLAQAAESANPVERQAAVFFGNYRSRREGR